MDGIELEVGDVGQEHRDSRYAVGISFKTRDDDDTAKLEESLPTSSAPSPESSSSSLTGQQNLGFELEEKPGLDKVDIVKDPTIMFSDFNGAVNTENEKSKDGKVKKKKSPKKPKKVNIIQLYSFASPFELLLMMIGLVCAIIQGSALQGPYVLMSDTIDNYARSINCSRYAPANETAACNDIVSESATRVSIGIAICGAIIVITYYLHVLLFTIVADRLTRRIRYLAFSNILRQDIGFFDVHFGGELNTRLTQDITKYEIGIGNKVSMMVSWFSAFVAGLVICLIRGWMLTLFMCALLPVAAIVSGITTRLMKIYTEKEMSAYARAGAVAEEALVNVRIVTAFAGQQKECKRYGSLLNEARKISVKSGLASAIGQGIPWFLTFSISGATIYLTGSMVNQGKSEPGFVLVLLGCMMQGLRALGFATALLENVFDSQGAAYGIYKLINAKTLIDSSDKRGKKLNNFRGLVSFENIEFSYPARKDVEVLKRLSLVIQPGQSTAFVGPSGCGKSTTIQLLQRFYDPVAGKVKVDDVDIKELNLSWLRSQIGVVSQDPILFAATIEENIRFGKPDATFEEITAAAKEADAHQFIMKLPEKYETKLNEQGTQLSRGEKQRISLARALVRKPKILLLDECTSALDNESEAAVQAALDKASKGRTTIIIAHRLSTVKDCDVLFVVNKGVVSEFGTHQELIDRQGLYQKLVSAQMTDDQEEDEDKPTEEEIRHRESRTSMPQIRSVLSIRSLPSFSSNIEKHLEIVDELNETGEEEEIKLKENALRQIFMLNKKQWPYLLFGTIGGLLLGATWPIFSLLLAEVLGVIVEMGDMMDGVKKGAFEIIGLGCTACVISIGSIFILRYFGESLTQIVRSLAYGAMLKQDVAWFDQPSNQVGSLTSRLADEASRIKMATGNTLLYLAAAVSSVILSVTISLVSSWQLGLAVLPLMPLTITAGLIQGYMNTTYEKKSHARTQASGRIASEAIDKIRTIAALTKEPYFLDSYMSHFNDMKKEARRRANIIGISQSFVWFCSCSIEIVSVGFGMWLVAEGLIEFKMVFRILTVALVMAAEVGRANANLPELTSSYTAAVKLMQLIKRNPEIDSSDDGGLKPVSCEGEVVLDNVSFWYPTRTDTLVVNSVGLTAKRGQSIAIVGPSGSGKSTIVQLIERFYDCCSGSLKIDNVEVRDLNVNWLRLQMSIVLQEPILFGVSIADNIAYGDNSREVPRQEIIEAAKAANIHDFICNLPQGYDTDIGSKGTQLSGGQKQRISIARALVRNPKILLLDDATSALDSQSEAVVEEALQKARSGRTSIMIAHRLSSVVNADVILYLRRGRVLEQGTHAQLMALKRHYYGLYQANLGNK